jgi:quinol monooxygenase YgiN
MTILPINLLCAMVVIYQPALDQYFSERINEQVLKLGSRHLLVRMEKQLDLSSLEKGCRGYHHQEGCGAKPTHSIERYVRALLVKYLYNWSYRETEERIQNDLVVKRFVGYEVLEEVLDHSALCLFEQWVSEHHPRLFFDYILKQIDRDFPEERGGVQIGDTFAMEANAAQESVVEILRHTSRLMLRELEQGAEKQYQIMGTQFDWQRLFGPKNEPGSYWLDKEQRKLRLENTVWEGWELIQKVKACLPDLEDRLRRRIEYRLEDLEKVIRDEFQLTLDASGKLEQIVRLDEKHKGSYRLCTATDPEATCRNHGGDQTVGYNVGLLITPHAVIREISAATGAQPDQAGIVPIIQEQLDRHGFCPDVLIYDQAAGSGAIRAEVAQVSHGQTQVVANIPPAPNQGRFSPTDFHLNEAGALVCPQQRTTTSHHRSGHRDGEHYVFSAKCCAACPLWSKCRDPKSSLKGDRKVFLSDYQDEIRQAQAYNQTPTFKQQMKLRPLVERVIFMLTNYDGARRARRRGLNCADFLAKMSAMARNLRTWLKLCEHKASQSGPSVSQSA